MKRAIFVNQSPNVMLCDIADVYSRAGYHCTLISGIQPPRISSFDNIVLLTPYNRQSAKTRLNTWYSFFRQLKKWLDANPQEFEQALLVSNPPFALYLPLFSGFKAKVVRIIVYDLYPDILNKMFPALLTFIPGLVLSSWNRKSFQKSDHIYTPSFSLKKSVMAYTEKEVQTVYNWAETSSFIPVAKNENKFLVKHGLQDKFIILYSGNLGATHDVETVLKAAGLLSENKKFLFLFIGDGEGMKKVKKAIAEGNNNCMCIPYQDEEMFKHSVACGNLAWMGYKKGYEDYSIPSKLPYYLSTGTPVAFIGNPVSETARMLAENNIGFVIENDRAEMLVNVIKTLEEGKDPHLSARCRDFALKHLSAINAQRFFDV